LIPFSVYHVFLKHINDIQSLVQRGMGVVYPTSSVRIWMEGVAVSNAEHVENGRKMRKTTYSTPVGDVTTLKEKMAGNEWIKECMFKDPGDYKVLKYMFSHQRFCEDYDSVRLLQAMLGSEFILRDKIPLEPLQQFITADIMDCASFSVEWYDNRDEIMELYQLNAKFHEQLYETIAQSPIGFANYGGNVIPQVIGPDVFHELYVPCYNRAADVFHENGKLLGTHLDADNTPIMDLIGNTRLDYIEAYDPSISPSLRIAKEKFKDKLLWINWPSGEHYRKTDEIAEITRALVKDYGADSGLLVAITEDLPKGRWDDIIHAILDGLGYPARYSQPA
jgi:hypothetical protein